jgi:hypothetical protein
VGGKEKVEGEDDSHQIQLSWVDAFHLNPPSFPYLVAVTFLHSRAGVKVRLDAAKPDGDEPFGLLEFPVLLEWRFRNVRRLLAPILTAAGRLGMISQ